ncbi:hypothetical protein HPB51_014705 [Rhipicephalus microplus]|uniref:DUF4371 domain-containing protein n=1 Tax=Rhipicephalus microplus TaxID=6941 RepID=A0A9J6DNH1_RHIMP|nr:hypothetical protein HPB51_014705 [Rhipicephalus microplus]
MVCLGEAIKKRDFQNLLTFRVDDGDHALKAHLHNSAKNAKYPLASIQNEPIKISEDLLGKDIVNERSKSGQYSLLPHESADIPGTEQLTIGFQFVDPDLKAVRQEFSGMVPLESMDVETISATIFKAVDDFGLNPGKIVGQGYDECSSMAGSIPGVQARIKKKHPRVMNFHCAPHRLNLVVNGASTVADVRNAVASKKATIKFFWESPLRRKKAPSLPLFCETRWTSQYESIRLFRQHLVEVMEALTTLSLSAHRATWETAHKLSCRGTPVNLSELARPTRKGFPLEQESSTLQQAHEAAARYSLSVPTWETPATR